MKPNSITRVRASKFTQAEFSRFLYGAVGCRHREAPDRARSKTPTCRSSAPAPRSRPARPSFSRVSLTEARSSQSNRSPRQLKLPRSLAAWRARAGYDTLGKARTPGDRHAGMGPWVFGLSVHPHTRRVGHAHLVRGDANNVGTATTTTTADAADHSRGRWRMAPRQCRAASAYNVPPQPAIARPRAGRHRAALDRGRGRGQTGASASLRSVQRGQSLSHPSEPAWQATSALGRGGAEAARRRPGVLRKAVTLPRTPRTGRRRRCGLAAG